MLRRLLPLRNEGKCIFLYVVLSRTLLCLIVGIGLQSLLAFCYLFSQERQHDHTLQLPNLAAAVEFHRCAAKDSGMV
jgi:hypothetical protein